MIRFLQTSMESLDYQAQYQKVGRANIGRAPTLENQACFALVCFCPALLAWRVASLYNVRNRLAFLRTRQKICAITYKRIDLFPNPTVFSQHGNAISRGNSIDSQVAPANHTGCQQLD